MKKSALLILTVFTFPLIHLFSQVNLLRGPEGIAYHPPTKSYYVTNANNGRIIRIDSLENQTVFYQGLSVPMGIECIGDRLFVASNDPSTVSCIDVTTGNLLGDMTITEAPSMAHMDYDPTTGFLYVIGQAGQIFKVDAENIAYTVFVHAGHGIPSNSQTCAVDTITQHLYVLSWPITYVRCVNLLDSTDIQFKINPQNGQYIDCIKGPDGNIYAASRQGNVIHKFPSDCGGLPEVFASGLSKPAGMVFNPHTDVIAVRNFSGNSLSYLPLTTTGLNENQKIIHPKLLISPNPFFGQFRISFDQLLPYKTDIYIYSESGSLCRKMQLPNDSQGLIDISGLTGGMYLVQLICDRHVWTRKVKKLDTAK